MLKTDFRDDIQGLRGLAVLIVVVYHTQFALPWGFVGVDVFFVISGFVITQLLLVELNETGTIRFRNFFARRARRLVPALSVMTVTVLAASVFIMSPFGEQQQIVTTSQFVSTFSANAYFFLQKSYFALSMNPFRHTWSLAVEEQFYFLFPLLLVFVWKVSSRLKIRLQRKFVLLVIVVLSSGSFVLSFLMSIGIRIVQLPTRFAFYGTPARIWEFGVGISLALLIPYFKKRNAIIGWLGAAFGIIIFAIACSQISAFTPFPGFVAVGPVVGTALFILAGTLNQKIYQLLGCAPFKFLGDYSYGWYLWHWPFIVYADVIYPGSVNAKVLAALLSFIPTVLSYRFIEQPIRHNESLVGRKMLLVSAGFIALPLAVSFGLGRVADTGLGLTQGSDRMITSSLADTLGCQTDGENFNTATCIVSAEGSDVTGNTTKTVLLIGDSQAGAASDGVASAAKSLGMNFAVWYNNGCPVFPRATEEREDCPFFQSEMKTLLATLKPDVVVVANSSTLYTTRGAQRSGVTIRTADNKLAPNYEVAVKSWTEGLYELFSSPEFTSLPIVYLMEVPESLATPRVSLLQPSAKESQMPLHYFYDRNQVVSAEESVLKILSNIQLVNPDEVLCSNNICQTMINGQYVYGDQYHLSPYGSRLLAPMLSKAIQESLDQK